jgi:hypothetical protein
MNKPPALAMAILTQLGPREEPIVGDLIEEYTTGRSRLWFWRQAIAAIAAGTIRGIRGQPLRAVGAVALGWTVLGLVFLLLGDLVADGLAGLVWDWNRQAAYGGGTWWPFQISATFVSYAGFALSGWLVARVHRRDPTMLVAYVASVVTGLAVGALVLEILIHRYGRVPVPHALFYIVSVTLPYHWRSGFLLVPCVMLICGLAAIRPPATYNARIDC